MCNPFFFVAAATSMYQQTEQNKMIRAQNRLQEQQFQRGTAAAHARFAAEYGAGEAEAIQQNEAETQELRQLGNQAAKAAGAVAVKGGGSGRPVNALLSDILQKEGDYRAASRRNALMRRGGLRRSAAMGAVRAGNEALSNWRPATPTTSGLTMAINAGVAGLNAYVASGGQNWGDKLGFNMSSAGGSAPTPTTTAYSANYNNWMPSGAAQQSVNPFQYNWA